jgi:hypothetical protein
MNLNFFLVILEILVEFAVFGQIIFGPFFFGHLNDDAFSIIGSDFDVVVVYNFIYTVKFLTG